MFVPCSEVCLLSTVAELHCIVSAPSRAAKLQGNVHLLNSKDSVTVILCSAQKHSWSLQNTGTSFTEEVLMKRFYLTDQSTYH